MQTMAYIPLGKHNLMRESYCRAQIPELCRDNPDRNWNYIVLFSLGERWRSEKRGSTWGPATLRSRHRHSLVL